MPQYKIKITTGNLPDAGTNADVKIRIGGSEAAIEDAPLIQLDRIWIDDFERHQTDTFKIEYLDVGEIEFIGLQLEPLCTIFDDAWYVDTIKIGKMFESDEDENTFDKSEEDEREEDDSEKDEKEYESAIVWHEFPIYSWIFPRDDEVQYFFTNKTSIPQKDSTTRQANEYRDQQILKNHINWTKSEEKLEKFPGYIETKDDKLLHHSLKFNDNRDRDFKSNALAAVRNNTFARVRNLFKEFHELEDYKKAAKRLWDCSTETILGKNVDAPPPYFENELWQNDEEFGRQMLNGMNPSWIERVKGDMPENIPVTNDIVGESLYHTLEEEIGRGRIYIINHNILTGVSTGNLTSRFSKEVAKLELAVPMCLFYVGSDGKLKPIAIQLGQDPDSFPIWTPNDGEWAWLLAKIWFRNADFQVHQMTSHLAYTHLLVEPIAIATFMCLPPQHPVYKLLRWHIQFVIAINTIGRKRIVSEVTYIFIRFSHLILVD